MADDPNRPAAAKPRRLARAVADELGITTPKSAQRRRASKAAPAPRRKR